MEVKRCWRHRTTNEWEVWDNVLRESTSPSFARYRWIHWRALGAWMLQTSYYCLRVHNCRYGMLERIRWKCYERWRVGELRVEISDAYRSCLSLSADYMSRICQHSNTMLGSQYRFDVLTIPLSLLYYFSLCLRLWLMVLKVRCQGSEAHDSIASKQQSVNSSTEPSEQPAVRAISSRLAPFPKRPIRYRVMASWTSTGICGTCELLKKTGWSLIKVKMKLKRWGDTRSMFMKRLWSWGSCAYSQARCKLPHFATSGCPRRYLVARIASRTVRSNWRFSEGCSMLSSGGRSMSRKTIWVRYVRITWEWYVLRAMANVDWAGLLLLLLLLLWLLYMEITRVTIDQQQTGSISIAYFNSELP